MNIAEQWNVLERPIAVFDTHAQIWHGQNVPSTSTLGERGVSPNWESPKNLLVDHHIGITTARYRCACHAQHQTYPVKGLQPSLQEDD